jgi:hypothetical protein
MNWRDYGADLGFYAPVYSEKSVANIIEMVIEDAVATGNKLSGEQGFNDEATRTELRAKWLGNKN